VTRRNAVFVIASAAMAVLFVRLGFWQLHRLADRRAQNALVASRLAEPPAPLADIPRDTARAQFRRVRFAGTYDFAHQIVLVERIRDGAPGVHLVTPLRPDAGVGGDTVVLVDRGWVYAPDGMSVDEERWRESTHVDAGGYVTVPGQGHGPAAIGDVRLNRLRWLDRRVISQRIGRPVASYAIDIQTDSGAGTTAVVAGPGTSSASLERVPVRVPPPTLDDGPHLSYAIQWFAFAVIAVLGPVLAVFVLPRTERWTPDVRHQE
jgi:surfeit locus 1 family protein